MLETDPVPFQPRRFRTSAEYYVRGRLPYPNELIRHVVSITGLRRNESVLDLGCGPGFLAVAFAPYAGRVLGLDPEPAMLEAAGEYQRANDAIAGHVTYRQGSSHDLDSLGESFHLVTMGRSFHWMDRAVTLAALDRVVTPGGAVVLFADSHLKVTQNEWRQDFRSVIEPYAARDTAHGRINRQDWQPHEAFLLASSFPHLQRVSVIARLRTPIERIIDRALSMSTTSPERLGDELDAVTGRLREILTPHARDGVIEEIVESEALIATRESAASQATKT